MKQREFLPHLMRHLLFEIIILTIDKALYAKIPAFIIFILTRVIPNLLYYSSLTEHIVSALMVKLEIDTLSWLKKNHMGPCVLRYHAFHPGRIVEP